MHPDVKKAAIEWLKRQNEMFRTQLDTPQAVDRKQSQDERAFVALRDANVRRESAIVDAIYNAIAGLP